MSGCAWACSDTRGLQVWRIQEDDGNMLFGRDKGAPLEGHATEETAFTAKGYLPSASFFLPAPAAC